MLLRVRRAFSLLPIFAIAFLPWLDEVSGSNKLASAFTSANRFSDVLQRDRARSARQIFTKDLIWRGLVVGFNIGYRTVEEDKADVLILGCTVNLCMFENVQNELIVPVIDPICTALKVNELRAGLTKRFGRARIPVGSCEPPPNANLAADIPFADDAFVGNSVSI